MPAQSKTPTKLNLLQQLLASYGPHSSFARARLRDRLRDAARQCREDAAHLRQRHEDFARRTGFPLDVLPSPHPRTLPTTPEGWEEAAREFEHLAEIAAGHHG